MAKTTEAWLSRSELRKLLRAALPSAADLNAFCIDYFEEVHKRFDDGMDSQSKLNLLLAITDCAEIEKILRSEYTDRVARYELRSSLRLSSREQREQELAEQLRQLLTDKETLRKYEGRRIDEEIAVAQAALRRGPRLNSGEVLANHYQLESKLGDGYYAEVWEALDLRSASQASPERVAVKVLHGKHSGEALQVKRFTHGARRMKTLSHRHILRIHTEAAEYEGFFFFAMELMCGGDLRQVVIRDKQRQHKSPRIQAILQIGEALQCAHEHGLIHRDVKPANILLNAAGNACLADFDLVLDEKERLTQSQTMLGTLGYAAPEQLEDGYRVDPRADVYGLGRTAMFVFYGRELPRHWFGPHQGYLAELEVSRAISEVLKRATAWDPSNRYPTVSAFCEALQEALSTTATPASVGEAVPCVSAELNTAQAKTEIFHQEVVTIALTTQPTGSDLSPMPVVLEAPVGKQSTWFGKFTPVRIGAVGMLLFLVGSMVGGIWLSFRHPPTLSGPVSEDLSKTMTLTANDVAEKPLPPFEDATHRASQPGTASAVMPIKSPPTVQPLASSDTGISSATRSVTRNRHRAHAPEVVLGTAEVRGSLDKDIIGRTMRHNLKDVTFCYEREWAKGSRLTGRLMIQFTISGTGNVIASMVQSSTINNQPVETCIATAVRGWVFPKPPGGGIVVVTYPYTFKL